MSHLRRGDPATDPTTGPAAPARDSPPGRRPQSGRIGGGVLPARQGAGVVRHDAVHAECGDRVPLRVAVERVDHDAHAGGVHLVDDRGAREYGLAVDEDAAHARFGGGAHHVVGDVLEDQEPRHDLRGGGCLRQGAGVEARDRDAALEVARGHLADRRGDRLGIPQSLELHDRAVAGRAQHVEELRERRNLRPRELRIEPRPGVERAHLGERERGEPPVAVGRAVDLGVVHEHGLPVGGERDIHLDVVESAAERGPDRGERVLGSAGAAAAMARDERRIAGCARVAEEFARAHPRGRRAEEGDHEARDGEHADDQQGVDPITRASGCRVVGHRACPPEVFHHVVVDVVGPLYMRRYLFVTKDSRRIRGSRSTPGSWCARPSWSR